MHESVEVYWSDINTPIEGRIAWLYADIKGLVTVGEGYLCDPIELALTLPFRKVGDTWATEKEIAIDWNIVKQGKLNDWKARGLTKLRLDDVTIDEITLRKLFSNEKVLKQTFTNWDNFGSDAQLGILSMAWSLGPYFTTSYPKFTAAVKSNDWFSALEESNISEVGNPGVAPRNKLNRWCFVNAGMVQKFNRSLEYLYYNTTKISASGLNAAIKSGSPSFMACYVQYQLQQTGDYTSVLDGEFGSLSVAAYQRFCKRSKLSVAVNTTNLKALAKASGYEWEVVE